MQKVKSLVTGPASPYLTGYIGEVVADEPRAALAARNILARGGNAADAAAALGMSLAVTLPSRASLGAGGACLAFDAASGAPPDAILFTPVAGPESGAGRGDRPASVPMLARGLFLLQVRHGSVGFDNLVRPAANLARNGITVSRALADDLAQVREPLLADSMARAIFAAGGNQVPAVGDRLVQPQLADTLDRITQFGVGDLYIGALANTFVAGADAAGGDLDIAAMRAALPVSRASIVDDDGAEWIGLLPPPVDGGLAMAASLKALRDGTDDAVAVSRAAAARWRAQHPGTVGAASGARAEPASAAAAALGQLPASTSFVVLDRSGNAVSCAISMDNLFGTGRVAGTTGIVLGASPRRVAAPLLAAGIAWTKAGHDFRAASSGSGQSDAAAATAAALHNALDRRRPIIQASTQSGRANVISCPDGLPGNPGSCVGETDPRGSGLAIGSN